MYVCFDAVERDRHLPQDFVIPLAMQFILTSACLLFVSFLHSAIPILVLHHFIFYLSVIPLINQSIEFISNTKCEQGKQRNGW